MLRNQEAANLARTKIKRTIPPQEASWQRRTTILTWFSSPTKKSRNEVKIVVRMESLQRDEAQISAGHARYPRLGQQFAESRSDKALWRIQVQCRCFDGGFLSALLDPFQYLRMYCAYCVAFLLAKHEPILCWFRVMTSPSTLS